MSQRTMDESTQAKQSSAESTKTKAFDINGYNGGNVRNEKPDQSTVTK